MTTASGCRTFAGNGLCFSATIGAGGQHDPADVWPASTRTLVEIADRAVEIVGTYLLGQAFWAWAPSLPAI